MKVLIAVTNDDCSDALINMILKHQWQSAQYRVVTVIAPVTISTTDDTWANFLQDISKDTRLQAEILLRKVALKLREATKSPHVEEAVLFGSPKEKIIEEAEQWKADLICIGSNGKNSIDRLLLGSVSQTVVAHSPCTVFVLKPAICEAVSATTG